MNGKYQPKVYFAMLWRKIEIIFYFIVTLKLRISNQIIQTEKILLQVNYIFIVSCSIVISTD